MKKNIEKLEEIYKTIKRETIDNTIYNLVISDERKNIKYSPSYQRNYIWNSKKAINLIETILLKGIIPPMTVIKVGKEIEIIDGRQRYETILRFYNNEIQLKEFGLQELKDLDGRYYKDLPPNAKLLFEEYKLKMISYTVDNLISVTEEDIDAIKRDLFRRYNYGMTALKRSEIERAKYLYDNLTEDLVLFFNNNPEFYEKCKYVLLPPSKQKLDERDKINLVLITIREMLVMEYIPIIGEKTIKVGASVFDKYYTKFIRSLNDKERENKLNEFKKIFFKLYDIKEKLKKSNNELNNNVLFIKTVYWMFAVLYKMYPDEFYNFNIDKFCHYVGNGGKEYFGNYKNTTASDIEKRYSYVNKYITKELELDIGDYIESLKENRKVLIFKPDENINPNEDWNGIKANKQLIVTEETLEVGEIIKLIKQNRFIIRPNYQRAEVKSRRKASRIIESIIIGVKLPPIYLYTKTYENGLSQDIVLDGQQRLIDILKFMGEPITDEDYNYIHTYKEKYALTGLKDLKNLNGKVYEEGENSINEFKRAPIKNYIFDVIRINERANENFDFVDMFLRLNQNPCPISINTFEMWNSFDIVKTINKIKQIAKYKLFQQYGNKMKEEELVTTLAYMDYEEIDIDNIEKFFSIYTYVENKDKRNEHYEIKLSVNNKSAITNFLEDLQPDSKEENEFIKSVDSVNNFIDKLNILSKEDDTLLIKIFNPNIKVPRQGNRKDFYITWLILQELDTHIISTYREEILKDLEELFKQMKNMPADKKVKEFINYVKSIINEYSKYNK